MFPPIPPFEEFVIRLQVRWYDQEHDVEVRLERWPHSNHIVLVCRFEDEPERGEWIVLGPGVRPYKIFNPRKMLFNRYFFDIATRQARVTLDFKDERLEKIKRIVQRAFAGDGFRIGRVLQIPDLPDELCLVLWSPVYALLNTDWSFREQNAICFEWRPSPHRLSEEQMNGVLMDQWNDTHSEPRFAWEWSRWNEQERVRRCTGFVGDPDELSQVMTWIFNATQKLWTLGEGWSWYWEPMEEGELPQTFFYTHFDDWQDVEEIEQERLLQRWEKVLLSHFVPTWRGDWLKKHLCVRQFWISRRHAEVSLNSPPTMHEQLEARLLLRDWLQDNVPDRIDLLPS